MVIASIPPTLSQIRAGILQVPLVMGVAGAQIYYDPTPGYESFNYSLPLNYFHNFSEGGVQTFYFGSGYYNFTPPSSGQDLAIQFDSKNVYTGFTFMQSGVTVCSLTAGNSQFYYNADNHIFRNSASSSWQMMISTGLVETPAISLGGTIGSSVDPGGGGLALTGSIIGVDNLYIYGKSSVSTDGFVAICGGHTWDTDYGAKCAFYGVSSGAPGAAAYYTGSSGASAKHYFYDLNAAAQMIIDENGVCLPVTATPASASATGTAGQIAFDSNYMYRCTATDTWKRAALTTW